MWLTYVFSQFCLVQPTQNFILSVTDAYFVMVPGSESFDHKSLDITRTLTLAEIAL